MPGHLRLRLLEGKVIPIQVQYILLGLSILCLLMLIADISNNK